MSSEMTPIPLNPPLWVIVILRSSPLSRYPFLIPKLLLPLGNSMGYDTISFYFGVSATNQDEHRIGKLPSAGFAIQCANMLSSPIPPGFYPNSSRTASGWLPGGVRVASGWRASWRFTQLMENIPMKDAALNSFAPLRIIRSQKGPPLGILPPEPESLSLHFQ